MSRPRVLYIVHNFPQMSHTYVRSEIEALQQDCDIHVVGLKKSDLEYRDHHPYERTRDPNRIRAIIREFRPDVLHSHWLGQVPTLAYFGGYYTRGAAGLEIPFTARAHSFDVLERDEAFLQSIVPIINSELCLGILAFPFTRPLLERAGIAERKIRDCYPVVNFSRFYDRSPNGEGVINVGACLPKKQMQDFVRLAQLVPSRPFHLYAMGFNVGEMERLKRELKSPVEVIPPVEPQDMAAEYKKHQWLVYTAAFNPSIVGWPMAAAEAQASGLGVCMPNLRPDLREYVGEGGVLYDRIEDIVDIVDKPVPHHVREEGFELARRSDIAVHKRLLLEMWAQADAAHASADRVEKAPLDLANWGTVGVDWSWIEGVFATIRELESAVPDGHLLIVDDGQLAVDLPESLGARFFPGPPADGAAAVESLERGRADGATAIAFVASSFWWLDYYRQLADHLRSEYQCVVESDRLVVFDLRTPNAREPASGQESIEPAILG